LGILFAGFFSLFILLKLFDCLFDFLLLYSQSSGDGCIFVWSLSSDLTMIMRKRLSEIQDQIPRLCALADAKSQKLNRFAFDCTRLPLWAQRSFLGDDSDMQSFSSTKSAPRFRGSWAQHLDAIAMIHNALLHVAPKRYDSCCCGFML
jgi:hypothetical protein